MRNHNFATEINRLPNESEFLFFADFSPFLSLFDVLFSPPHFELDIEKPLNKQINVAALMRHFDCVPPHTHIYYAQIYIFVFNDFCFPFFATENNNNSFEMRWKFGWNE